MLKHIYIDIHVQNYEWHNIILWTHSSTWSSDNNVNMHARLQTMSYFIYTVPCLEIFIGMWWVREKLQKVFEMLKFENTTRVIMTLICGNFLDPNIIDKQNIFLYFKYSASYEPLDWSKFEMFLCSIVSIMSSHIIVKNGVFLPIFRVWTDPH